MIISDNQEEVIEGLKIFLKEEVAPFDSDYEKNESLPLELIKRMGSRGYLTATMPKEFGGLGLDPVYYGVFTEEIGQASCAVRSLICVHNSLVGETLNKWGTPKQKEDLLPLMALGEKIGAFALSEPNIGSDAKNVTTTYSEVGGTFVINGTKKWITFGGKADFFIVIATNDNNTTAFIVEKEREGVTVKPIKGTLAGKATQIAEIEFKQVEVPKENILGNEGGGFTYIVNTALDYGRYSVAWAGTSVIQASVEEMVTYSRKREQFGQKLFHFQLIQGMIADAVVKAHAARALCVKAGELRRDHHPDAIMETAIAKYFTSNTAMQVTTDAVQVHGANGCHESYKVERLFREAKTLQIIEGTTQILQEIISMHGLRKYYTR